MLLELTLCHLHFAGPIEIEQDNATEPSAPAGPKGTTVSQLSSWNSVCMPDRMVIAERLLCLTEHAYDILPHMISYGVVYTV